jgi:hypothetical protein
VGYSSDVIRGIDINKVVPAPGNRLFDIVPIVQLKGISTSGIWNIDFTHNQVRLFVTLPGMGIDRGSADFRGNEN